MQENHKDNDEQSGWRERERESGKLRKWIKIERRRKLLLRERNR